MPPDPIILHYTIDPSVPPPERPLAWDVEVKTEDGALKNRMTAMLQTSKETIQDAAKLDEEVRFISSLSCKLAKLEIDCTAHTIAAKRSSEAHVLTFLRQGSGRIHTDMAGFPITRSGKHTW